MIKRLFEIYLCKADKSGVYMLLYYELIDSLNSFGRIKVSPYLCFANSKTSMMKQTRKMLLLLALLIPAGAMAQARAGDSTQLFNLSCQPHASCRWCRCSGDSGGIDRLLISDDVEQ